MLNAARKVKTHAEYVGPWSILRFKFDKQCPLPLLAQQFLLLTIILQTFTRIDPPTSAADPYPRFDYFTKAVLPSLPRNTSTSILIFLGSYFNFLRMRSHLHNTPISVGAISEETPVPFVARARSHSSTGRHSVLLTAGERTTPAATTSEESQAYSTRCRITLFSTGRSRVALLGGALAREGLRRRRRCVWYSPSGML